MIDHTGRSTNPSCWSGSIIWSESGWLDKRSWSSSSSSSSRSLVAMLTQENRSKEEKKAEDMVAATQAATWSSFSRERILRALLSVFSIRSEQRFPTRFRLPIEESNSKYAVGGSDLREELGDEIEGSISS